MKRIREIKNPNLLTAYSSIDSYKDMYIINLNCFKFAINTFLNYNKPDLYIQFSKLITNDILFYSKNYQKLISELSQLEGNTKVINNIYRIIQDIVGNITINGLEKEYLEPIINLIVKLLISVKEVEKLNYLIGQLELEMKMRIELLKNKSLKRLELTMNQKISSII